LHTLDRAQDQGFGYVQGDHGHTVGVVDVPTDIFVLIVERDGFDVIGLKAGNDILEELT